MYHCRCTSAEGLKSSSTALSYPYRVVVGIDVAMCLQLLLPPLLMSLASQRPDVDFYFVFLIKTMRMLSHINPKLEIIYPLDGEWPHAFFFQKRKQERERGH